MEEAGSGVNDGIWLALIGAVGSAGSVASLRLGCSARSSKLRPARRLTRGGRLTPIN